jgi:hypothetical protein
LERAQLNAGIRSGCVGSQLVKNMPIGIASFQASTLENGQSLAGYIAKSLVDNAHNDLFIRVG